MNPEIRIPHGLPASAAEASLSQIEFQVLSDLRTLRHIVEGLERLETRLNISPIPKAIAQRGYFTPDEDDRVRQGVLVYRNCRLAAYEIILRYRKYAAMEPERNRLRCFLVAFGAGLVLYSKSLRIIAFAEHVPMLRAKMNEPDSKYDMEAGFFDDVLAGYSRLCNYRSIRQADAFWRAHRRQAQTSIAAEGEDWAWLVELIRRQRNAIRKRLLYVLWQRLRHDWSSFRQTLWSPVNRARQGLEKLLGDHLAGSQFGGLPARAFSPEILGNLRSLLQPGDVILVRAEDRLAATLLPGFWTHAALFLGGYSDLESLGLQSEPYVSRHWPEIVKKSGKLGCVIEALFPCVQMNPLEKCLEADHVVALRPILPPAEIGCAIAEALGHLGKPYDFDFDFNQTSRIVCTELVYRSYHKRGPLAFSLTKRLGRYTLTGDDIVNQALDGMGEPGQAPMSAFQPVAMVLKRRDGQWHIAQPERVFPLLRRIRRGWRPARTKGAPESSNR